MKSTVLLSLIFATTLTLADGLREVQPEEVGFSSERLGEITAYTRREVDEGRMVGVVTMVARHGKIVHFDTVGSYGLDNQKPIEN